MWQPTRSFTYRKGHTRAGDLHQTSVRYPFCRGGFRQTSVTALQKARGRTQCHYVLPCKIPCVIPHASRDSGTWSQGHEAPYAIVHGRHLTHSRGLASNPWCHIQQQPSHIFKQDSLSFGQSRTFPLLNSHLGHAVPPKELAHPRK